MADRLLDPSEEMGLELGAPTNLCLQLAHLVLWDSVVARVEELRDSARALITVSPTERMLQRGHRVEVDLSDLDAFRGDAILPVGDVLPYRLYVVQEHPLRVADRRLWCQPQGAVGRLKLLLLFQVEEQQALVHIGVRTPIRALRLSLLEWAARGFAALPEGKSIWRVTVQADGLGEAATAEAVDIWLANTVVAAADLLDRVVSGSLERDLARESLEREDLVRLRSVP